MSRTIFTSTPIYNMILKRGGIMRNDLVVKANDLIEARYSLNLNEQKIILYAVSKIDRNKDKFNILQLSIKEFMELLGASQFRYAEIKAVVKGLMSKQLSIKTDKTDLVVNWVSSIQYTKDTGIIELEFSEKLVPYLLQLKEKFTRYQLKNILYLKNKYSIRIYELLKQYENIGKRTFTIKEIKETLSIQDKYKDFRNLEKWVIKPSIKEINEHTDIMITYAKNKLGRSIESLTFTIESKEDKKYIEYLDQTYNIKEFKERAGLESENFNAKQVLSLYEIAVDMLIDDYESEDDLFEYIRLNYLLMQEKKGVKNSYSYLVKALKGDYAIARGQIKLECKIE